MSDEEQQIERVVKNLLAAIEEEKRKLDPDKELMRLLFKRIWQLKEDWRTTYTGQEARFLMHTSMRTWRDDA